MDLQLYKNNLVKNDFQTYNPFHFICDQFIKLIDSITGDYDKNKINAFILKINFLLEQLPLLIEVSLDSEYCKNPNKRHYQILLSLMKSLRFSIERNDYSMLRDLLDYELKDSLKSWKIESTRNL